MMQQIHGQSCTFTESLAICEKLGIKLMFLRLFPWGLTTMERNAYARWISLYSMLKRTDKDIEVYLDSIREVEDRARSCYEGSISLSSNEFVKMMVLDGCFILELFRGAAEGFEELGYARHDPVFAKRSSTHCIQRDMLLLENQIPLFILDRLLELQFGDPNQKGDVAERALRFFDSHVPTDEPLTKSKKNKLESSSAYEKKFDSLADKGGLHCLDVFRRSLLRTVVADQGGVPRLDVFRRCLLRTGPKPVPENWTKTGLTQVTQLIHCVTELREAGIKFKTRKTDRLLDIKFEKGVLRIPRLFIQDGTKSLFLNLIAFEQCHLDCSNDFTSYAIFMDNLINSPQDVAYLHYCGIIEHWLGNDADVADLFNRLCQEVVFDINESYLSELFQDVNRFYNRRWNTWCASLKHNYFSNPWAIISLVAAVVLLLLTFAQSFYGVYGYYRPN